MEEKKLPIKMIAPGTTYRCDDDSTHSPMFHQIEGLVVDKMSTMADLKATIQELLKGFFQMEKIPIRFRPSYFPFHRTFSGSGYRMFEKEIYARNRKRE